MNAALLFNLAIALGLVAVLAGVAALAIWRSSRKEAKRLRERPLQQTQQIERPDRETGQWNLTK